MTTLLIVALIYAAAILYPPFCLFLAVIVVDLAYLHCGMFAPYLGLVQMAVFIAGANCCYKSYRRYSQDPGELRMLQISVLSMILPMTFFMSAIFNSQTVRESIVIAVACTSPALSITLQYFRNKIARLLFCSLATAQLLLAILVLLPYGSAATLSYAEADFFDEEGRMPEALLTISDISHGRYLKNFAQFNNPVNLAFDAAIVLTIGISLLFAKRIVFKIGGGALILLGLFMVPQSFLRGIILGVLLGIVAAGFKAKINALRLGSLVAVFGVGILLVASGDKFNSLPIFQKVAQTTDAQEEEYRLNALKMTPQFFFEAPLAGAGNYKNAIARSGMMPHQYPLFILLVHGLPAFSLLMVLTWFQMAFLVTGSADSVLEGKSGQSLSKAELAFCCISGCLVFCTSMTNHIGADMPQWIMWGAAAYPWAIMRRETITFGHHRLRKKNAELGSSKTDVVLATN